jgi:hypothetical protein
VTFCMCVAAADSNIRAPCGSQAGTTPVLVLNSGIGNFGILDNLAASVE